MLNTQLQNQIKKIKIHTKRIMQSTLSGDYLSAFKGSGLEFDQIREYQRGDDIRSIDWNSSAKMNKMMVKQFIEERDRTVILAIDVSASTTFSSRQELRKTTIANLACTLAFIASNNKDKVGALFFSDGVEQWIPPSKGNIHLGRIVESIFSLKPTRKKTDLAQALKFLISLKKRNAVVFMLSDWITPPEDYQKFLKIAGCEYDFVGIRITDPTEHKFPDIGLLDLQDSETGNVVTINTGRNKALNLFLNQRLIEQKRLFDKSSIDLLDLAVDQSFVNPLIKFFHQRTRRQI